MSLSPRRIALQGLGAGALALALQGFAPLPVDAVQPPADEAQGFHGGGGQVRMSEWLRRLKERAEADRAAVSVRPAPAIARAAAAGPQRAATSVAKRRRREEEALLLQLT